jgi:hypothetical protein
MADWDTRHEWSYANIEERLQMFCAEHATLILSISAGSLVLALIFLIFLV